MTGLRETLDPKGEKQPGLTWSVLPLRQPSTLQMRNVLDKIPLKAQDEIHQKLLAMYHARSREEALRLRAEFVDAYRSVYPNAVASLLEAGDRLFSYFDFPRSHWKSIKSTNVIESIFSDR